MFKAVVLLLIVCLAIASAKTMLPRGCAKACLNKAFSSGIPAFNKCREQCLKNGGFDDAEAIQSRIQSLIESLNTIKVSDDVPFAEEEIVESDSESGFGVGETVCVNAGLNARWSPCGQIASQTNGNTQGKVLGVQQQACLGGNYQWVNIEVSGGGKLWIANVNGNSIYRCGGAAPPVSGGDLLNTQQLLAIMPNLGQAKANEYIGHLNEALRWADITTCYRKSAFLAQLAHESVQLRYMEEIADGSAYEWRKDLGNTQPGDGRRYKGRGPIQLTGRSNYRWAGKDLGVDLEGNPTLAATPQWGFKIASWYWKTRNLNNWADWGNQAGFDETTRRVNGGYNGKADRDKYYWRARGVFGC